MAKQQSATRRIIKIVLIVIVVLVLLGVVGAATGLFGGGESGVAVETGEAERRDVTQVVTAFGRVQPEVEVVISPDVPGEIIELPVEEGAPVRKGQLLARINPDDYAAQEQQAEAGVSQSKANLAERKADLEQARTAYERQQKLFERNVGARSDLEQAQTQLEAAESRYEAAKYQVESAEARAQEAQKQLGRTAIYAPMDGTVSKLNVEQGERVVGTSQMAGTEMMRIARLDQMEVEVDVNENDVVNIALGDTASVEVDAYPERTFEGIVTEIANSARVSAEGTQEQVTNFPVKIRLLSPHNAAYRAQSGGARPASLSDDEGALPTAADVPVFRPGMSSTVDIFTQTVTDVVAVPIQAVTVRDFNKLGEEGEMEAAPAAEAAEEDASGPAEAEAENGAPERARGEDLRKVVFLVETAGEGDAKEAKMVEVETGISDDSYIAIQSGLQGGEEVIVGPYRAVSQELEPGTAVRIQEAEGAFASAQE